MTPAECRRQAARILREAAWSMVRDVREAQRLLPLADGHDQDEVPLRRYLEAVEPEFFVAGRLQ